MMNVKVPFVIEPLDDTDNFPGFSGNYPGGHGISHLSVDSGKKPNKCNICNKSFTRKRSLKEHSLTHSGEKPHVCNICNKSYTQNRSLKDHLLTHSGERPHVCNICNKSYTQTGHLRSHLLTHSGEKSHVCFICSKSFFQKSSLKMHLLTHSGEKPHVCIICNKSFTQKGQMKKHLLTHSGGKPHGCNICDKSFSHKWYLNKHIIQCRKTYEKNSSSDRVEELSSTSKKSENVNSDCHLDETSENSHENNHPGKLQVKEEIDYIVKEEHDISDEEYNYPNVGKMLIKSDVDFPKLYCAVKEENIQNELNDLIKEEHDIDYEDAVY